MTSEFDASHGTRDICAFCCQSANFAKSHIIPNAFYRRLISDENHAVLLSADSGIARKVQTGLFDKRLLCIDCEARYFSWDRYGTAMFLRDMHLPHERFLFPSLESLNNSTHPPHKYDIHL